MAVSLPVVLVMLAQAAEAPTTTPQASQTGVYGPASPAAPAPPKPTRSPAEAAVPQCSPRVPDPNAREIVVCAIKPEGYRPNPDVLEAKREMRNGGKPKPPENFKQNDCATIGPMGCRGTYFNIIAAAATAAEVADRLSKGEEVESLLVTDPHPSEYQLYLDAKKRREAKEAEAAALKRAKAAAAASKTPPPDAKATTPSHE